ncbi:citrate lyase acyl carrier protein [Aminiphilus circumscriptus]|jgi:citrate lyase subunit gamma (acyl carrier protein)|uniref:citrate lyase acyl carrier protein n=1 Tax=Aminiphilus circumscriptus TaxID=290732 RepID=UPI0004928260|nr:citrate lyase acyl carrier protein [Aminiphilus circumscriptus]
MKTASAGTVESMDCLVTVSEGAPGSGLSIQLSGAATARFAPTMRKAVQEVATAMGATDLSISIQDNGALDLILKARTEAALTRYRGGDTA